MLLLHFVCILHVSSRSSLRPASPGSTVLTRYTAQFGIEMCFFFVHAVCLRFPEGPQTEQQLWT